VFIADVSWRKKVAFGHSGQAIAKSLLSTPHFRNESDGLALRSRKTNERFRLSAAGR
jgi:hypothetical protein